MEIQTKDSLKDVLNFLKQGNPFEAQRIISTLFETELENRELIYTNKCCIFWIDSIKRLREIEDSYERSENILLEWKTFQHYISRENSCFEPALIAVQHGFFTNALAEFNKLLEERDPQQKAEIYRKAGICYKKLGDFENARVFLTEANKICPNLASVIAELADCYSLCGDDKIGKVLFREAFFNDPDSIDLDFLDSQLIKCLIERTEKKGYSGKELRYWIPIYGVLSGVFNIKRELTSQEVARLKKDIFALENEINDPSCKSEILVPRLLNCYFWLMDHYDLANENQAKISEVLVKIKILDSSIYEAYTK